MSNKLYSETAIQNIASSIRNKNGTQNTYTVSQMPQAILDIPTGGQSYNNGKNNFWIYIDTANTNVNITVDTSGDTIDWGDGTVDTNTSHIYVDTGVYIISADSLSNISGGNIIYIELNNATTLSSYTSNTSLMKVKLNNLSFTTLASNTLQSCTSLTEVDIPYVTSISNNTFKGCSSLTSINLSNVQEISNGAFGNCISLSGHLDISNTTLTGYDESSGDNGAFMDCTGITSVTIGAIEPYDSSKRNAAFQRCTGLTTATILGGTSTGRATFAKCYSLRTVYLPDTITEIGHFSFLDCSNLTLYIRATTPPNLLEFAFRYASVSAIYVPAESVDTYKTATGWSDYASIIQAEPTVGE